MSVIEAHEARAAALSALLLEKFGLKGPDILRQTRRLGRRVPKSVRADLALVGQAAQVARHPKLTRQHQPEQIAAAAARATTYLKAVDPADRRRGALLSWAGGNAFSLLLILAFFVAVARLRGLV